jgi:hypothetical protein
LKIAYLKRQKVYWIWHILHRNCLLIAFLREGEEEDISSYWKTLRKRKDTGN